jgi:type I restriction enzyme S subunit
MASEWQEFKISELLASSKNAVAMGPFGSRIKAENFVSFGVPVIKGAQLHGTYLKDVEFDFLKDEKADELRTSMAFRGDLVITHRGTIGQVSVIPYNSKYENYIVSQSQLKITFDKNKINPYFVSYFFKTSIGQHRLLANASQVGVPAIAKASSSVKDILIPCPDLKIQNDVVFILKTLDDKIELNRQMNTTLESMAQALFKSWFVDFDPVIDNALAAGKPIPDELQAKAAARLALGEARKPLPADIQALFPSSFILTEEMGWVPEGWEDLNLSSLLEIKYGKDHKLLNDGSIPVYGSGGLMRYADTALFSGESILIPRKGTLSNLMYVNETFWTVDTMFYSVPKIKNIAKYLFYFLKTFDFNAMNVGSAVPSMTTKVLNELKVIKPSAAILKIFDSYLSIFFNKNKNLQDENKYLTKLRDTLLPKLLSGELRIPDAEKIAAEVL